MGCNTDATYIQIRMLNTGKGPAVQALRAQSDKRQYALAMKATVESQPNLDVKQAEARTLLVEGGQIAGVETSSGTHYLAPAVVMTTGTFLNGRLIRGQHTEPGGRSGEPPSLPLTDSLRSL